jgi:hypothetical protein
MRVSARVAAQRQRYFLKLGGAMRIGRLARYLSQQEAFIDTSTLELARPVQPTQRVQDIDIQAGDRLVIFAAPPGNAELPAPLNPGDKVIKLIMGDTVVSSRGKKSLLIGKPDPSREVDVDVRTFVSPKQLNFISRELMRLEFDERSKTWYAQKLGRTRLLVNNFELQNDRIPLGDESTLKLYRANEEPTNPAFRPMVELKLVTETVQSRDDIIYLDAGDIGVTIHVGVEKDSATLNISENVAFGQVITGLAAHMKMRLDGEYQLAHMRLLPPQTELSSLTLAPDEFLYAARAQSFATNVLVLRDLNNRERKYELVAGPEDDEKLIGRRPEASVEDPELDVDLYDTLMERAGTPNGFKGMSRRQFRVFYRAAENTWWAQMEDRASVPLYVNNTRAAAGTPVQLTSGDVISVGATVENYVARLEVEITAKAE